MRLFTTLLAIFPLLVPSLTVAEEKKNAPEKPAVTAVPPSLYAPSDRWYLLYSPDNETPVGYFHLVKQVLPQGDDPIRYRTTTFVKQTGRTIVRIVHCQKNRHLTATKSTLQFTRGKIKIDATIKIQWTGTGTGQIGSPEITITQDGKQTSVQKVKNAKLSITTTSDLIALLDVIPHLPFEKKTHKFTLIKGLSPVKREYRYLGVKALLGEKTAKYHCFARHLPNNPTRKGARIYVDKKRRPVVIELGRLTMKLVTKTEVEKRFPKTVKKVEQQRKK